MGLTVLVDYDSGNLHSAEKAFQRMALETGAGEVIVSDRPEDVARATRVVLPGDGAFPACRRALLARDGLFEAIAEAAMPLTVYGICGRRNGCLATRRRHTHPNPHRAQSRI